MTLRAQITANALGLQPDTLRAIFENLPVGVIVAGADGSPLFFNPEAERVLGIGRVSVPPAEWTAVYGFYLPDRVTPYPSEQLPLTRAMRGEEVVDELIFIRNAQQPAGVWIRASSGTLRDAARSVCLAVVTFQDVTEQRKALQTFTLLSSAVEQTADSVILTDKQGIIEYVNPAFEATTGYSREETLGRTPRILKSGLHDVNFYKKLWDQVLSGQPFRETIVNRKKTGELYWAQQTISPIKDEVGNITHLVSVLKDVTELRKKEQQEVQLRLAREVQQRFYAEAPSVAGFDIAGAAYPADVTGGDYFDFISMPDGRLWIAVGDVSGHGVDAALVMALTRAYLRSWAAMELDGGEILTRVNQMLANDLNQGRFVTLILVCLDPHNRSLRYANAGHVPGFLLGRSGQVECELKSTGHPLGLFPAGRYSSSKELRLESAKTVVLLTDGITESKAPDAAEFGPQRVIEYISAHRQDPARQIVDGLCQAARAFAANQPQADDITAVVLKA